METTTTTTTVRTCLLCGDADDPAKPLLTGGNGLACIRCDEDVRSVLRRHLEPVAAQGRYNVDMLMSLVLYKRSDGRAEIHLLTPKPGQVIGARGATATAIRDDLLPLSKVLPLRLNLVEFEPDLEPKAAAEA